METFFFLFCFVVIFWGVEGIFNDHLIFTECLVSGMISSLTTHLTSDNFRHTFCPLSLHY